ncbi:MAG: aminotransferase class V-fold PLP-dependent enzyme [Alphaproteobacteria bacterium]|nr:aminotransferase class V-fold PLP-dependent enzyme [Alphaproteobacteria bacterium]
MLSEHLRRIAVAQVERGRAFASAEPPELSALVERALTPAEIHQALLKERPLLDARLRLEGPEPSPRSLREECAAVGLLDATPLDTSYRRLFPSLDLGIYCAHHAMGKPSEVLLRAMEEHHGHLFHHGVGAWEVGGWGLIRDAFRARVADLVGADLLRGDVARFENFSDALAAVLDSGIRGRLLSGADHFTSARYVHGWWAERTGGTFVEIEGDADEWVTTDAYIRALTPDTAAVSISTAHWRTGRLHDLGRLAAAMDATCPDAALLVDGYQSLGTVPFRIDGLPLRTAVMGGGIKQLHAGTGSGFAWLSHALLADLDFHRTGWFAHADPLAFAPPPLTSAKGAFRWQTGAPDVAPMQALVTELEVLATYAGGSLRGAIDKVRLRTSRTIERAMRRARSAGLEVVGEEPASQRGPILSIRVQRGEKLLERLSADGIVADYRPSAPGAPSGLLRLSTAAAAFDYELEYALERVVSALG